MFQNILGPDFIFRLIAVLIGLVIHEFAHALVADWLGDKTARLAGRVTLNPVAHLDPIGLIMILFAPIGWARPTPVNPSQLRHPKSGTILVALAGPVSNILIASICLVAIRSSGIAFASSGFLPTLFWEIALVNMFLFIFNLIPLPPLDGSKVLENLLPSRLAYRYHALDTYGPFILLLLVILPPLRNHILYPLLDGFVVLMLHLFGLGMFGF